MSVFKGVGVESLILNVQNSQKDEYSLRLLHDTTFENIIILDKTKDIDKLFRPEILFEFEHLENYDLLGDICYISYGLRPNANEKIAKGEFGKDDLISDVKTDINSKKYIEGKYIKPYQINEIKFLEWDTERVPNKIRRPTFPELYEHSKIIRGTTTGAIYDDTQMICNHSCSVIVSYESLKGVENKSIKGSIKKWTSKSREELEIISQNYDLWYILAILNSNMSYSYLNSIRKHRIRNYFYPDDLKKLPIKQISSQQQEKLANYAQKITKNYEQIHKINNTFKNWLKNTFEIDILSKKLENYHELTFKQFLNEIKKNKVNTKKLETYTLLEEGYNEFFIKDYSID